MSFRIDGGVPGSSLTESDLRLAKQGIGVSLSDLKDAREAFEKRRVAEPDGVTKLITSFEEFDDNKDEVVSIEEMLTYNRRGRLKISGGEFNLLAFGGEGVNKDQLKVFEELTDEADSFNSNLNTLVRDFERYDRDKSGSLDNEEIAKFAKRQDVPLPSKQSLRDPSVLENTLINRGIESYANSKGSTKAFLVSLFVA